MDSRESADPHSWVPYFSADVQIVRGTLDVGDFALAALPDAAVIERKSCPDMYQCLGRERERFERELIRGRYVGRMVVVIEGTMADLFCEARRRGGGLSDNSIIGSLATWQRLYCPFFFSGSVQVAAQFTERYLRGQITEAARTSKALAKAEAATA
jgi:DNA excision repair protein ERCC-4